MPLRSPMSLTISTNAWPSPKRASIPSVSAFVIRPRSKSSMAKATALPVEMVSMPYSSHSSLAAMMAAKSVTPQDPPNRPMVSYSGRARAPAKGPSLTSVTLPQATEQW